MAQSPPLVLDPAGTGQVQQLQPGNDVAIPANQRLDILEYKLNLLIQAEVDADLISLPDELTQDLP